MEDTKEKYHNHHFRRFASIFLHAHFDVDVVDRPANNLHISNFDIFLLGSSIFTHIVDMGFDYNVAFQYLFRGKTIYFVWTMCLILIPSLINVIISKRMQHQDKRGFDADEEDDRKTLHLMIKNKIYCGIAVILQLAPVLHYWETLIYALKSRKCEKSNDRVGQRQYYLKMLKEDQDVALLRVFECFLEAAPQQILQLSLMLKYYHNEVNYEFVHQVGSVVSSLVSMGWVMASYHRSIRLAQDEKYNIDLLGSAFQFFSHFFITVTRILSISVIASVWPLYTVICCVIHWMIVTIWILIDSHGLVEFCRSCNRPPHVPPTIKERIRSVLFAAIIGIVHTFIYLNVVAGNTFWKHLIFYTLCTLENVAAVVLWRLLHLRKLGDLKISSSEEVKNAWYFDVIPIVCLVSFVTGIVSIILYYIVFHPPKWRRSQNVPLQTM
ncbi:XK-related protein 6-like [Pseudomyrmex gracilis]|uniref:XK-related protein 6-like n=1 Tax=Pseudomyrmex gracilis TaxID=219809 RepID=UPI00099495EA|nr:XK-related protein 6-like [Pseudomyrmex gracilis]